jgi:DNA-binding beta-propeller fold protein YncE
MNALPQLRKLEQTYPNELSIIGIHTAKFTSELQTSNVRVATRRYQVYHPVLNDNKYDVWGNYMVSAWPTIIIIGPDGRIIGGMEGEINFEQLRSLMQNLIDEFDVNGMLVRSNSQSSSHQSRLGGHKQLAFPGKLAIDPASELLYISDSNHNRLVVSSLEGQVVGTIGEGSADLKDGGFSSATFNNPQGLAIVGRHVYIADTGNHAIRDLNLDSRSVKTILDTSHVTLSSPWDLTYLDGILYFAMAGIHQIWDLDLTNMKALPFAGSGTEGIIDGTYRDAQLAQPSGIVAHGDKIFFADSETSSIRFIDLHLAERVETIIGKGLFDFGDVDGKSSEVKLQHPLALSIQNEYLYITDTYNNKIKRISIDTGETKTIAGSGQSGFRNGTWDTSSFYEPGGIEIYKNKIYVADTNNHAIRIIDLESWDVGYLDFTWID